MRDSRENPGGNGRVRICGVVDGIEEGKEGEEGGEMKKR